MKELEDKCFTQLHLLLIIEVCLWPTTVWNRYYRVSDQCLNSCHLIILD